MDIHSKGAYPAWVLSNFAAHRFVLDGIVCESMEGFLQALKYRNQSKQRRICRLVGKEAKAAGGRLGRLWRLTGTLHWRGARIRRRSPDYQALLDRAYDALFAQCEDFRAALRASGQEVLTHSIGKADPRRTVLTEAELLDRLLRLRARLG